MKMSINFRITFSWKIVWKVSSSNKSVDKKLFIYFNINFVAIKLCGEGGDKLGKKMEHHSVYVFVIFLHHCIDIAVVFVKDI